MNLFGLLKPKIKASPDVQRPIGDVANVPINDNSIYKAYIPGFLYKPPYGYPRNENLILIRNLAKNPYVYAVTKTLQDEAASTPYDIVYKKEAVKSPAVDAIRLEILKFLDNPNNNKESFGDIMRKVVRDICEIDSGVIIKVFNKGGRLTQLFAHDGGSFLKNPDIHGYMGGRQAFVQPVDEYFVQSATGEPQPATIARYDARFKDFAAYFQYGFTGNALPVPFGMREVIYLMQNPRSDSIYGISPVALLADVLTSLVYGVNYNLDFYMNNNMPEGVLEVLGANQDQVQAIRERLSARVQFYDSVLGKFRRQAFKIPVMNVPTKFTAFNLDPKVMQILEQQQWFSKLVWACYGISPDEMGFTEDSNRATGQNQHTIYKRKAVRPILQILKYSIDKEIISEWGQDAFDALEFKWDDYDIEADLKKHMLFEQQIRMGIKTPKMVAGELGIDYTEVEAQKAEERKNMIDQGFNANTNTALGSYSFEKPEPKPQVKSAQPEKGIDVEKEHKETVDFIKEYFEKNKKLPPNEEIYKHIAQNHISEDKKYYDKLQLMESGVFDKLITAAIKSVNSDNSILENTLVSEIDHRAKAVLTLLGRQFGSSQWKGELVIVITGSRAHGYVYLLLKVKQNYF